MGLPKAKISSSTSNISILPLKFAFREPGRIEWLQKIILKIILNLTGWSRSKVFAWSKTRQSSSSDFENYE
jgi:hypothetical protein